MLDYDFKKRKFLVRFEERCPGVLRYANRVNLQFEFETKEEYNYRRNKAV